MRVQKTEEESDPYVDTENLATLRDVVVRETGVRIFVVFTARAFFFFYTLGHGGELLLANERDTTNICHR